MMAKPKERTILPGLGYPEKPGKNFLVENIKILRHMQKETQKKLQLQNTTRSYSSKKNAPTKARIYHKGSKSEQELCNTANSFVSRLSTPVTAMASPKPVKNQGMQTVAVEQFQKTKKMPPKSPDMSESVDRASVTKPINGIVRSASLPPLSCAFTTELPTSKDVLKESSNDDRDNNVLKELIGEPKDFVTYNTFRTYPKKTKSEKQDPAKPPPNYRMGEVPKYLRTSKKDLSSPECHGDSCGDKKSYGEGFVQLCDKERNIRLEELKKTYAELIGKLRNIPLSSDSYSNRQKKMNLEKELEKLEKLMNSFSRNRLYLKDAPS